MPFVKGKSGNPGGRPKIVSEIRELAKKDATRAYSILVEKMEAGESWAVLAVLKLAGVSMQPDEKPEGSGEQTPAGLEKESSAKLYSIAGE